MMNGGTDGAKTKVTGGIAVEIYTGEKNHEKGEAG